MLSLNVTETKKIAGLDSLRFFAFFSIFLYHAASEFKVGYLGVDFFFVLSSFLLTYLAYQEIENMGSFSKKNFFVRRSLRIFPLYFLVVTVTLVLLPIVANSFGINITLPEDQYMYWLLISNFETSDCLFALKFLWSIAVEEQFYLLFIAFSFLFKKHLWIFLTLLFTSYLVFMIIADNYEISTYSNTITHFSNFGIGMLAGYFYYKKSINIKLVTALFFASSVLLFFEIYDIIFHLILSCWFATLMLLVIKIAPSIKNNIAFKVTEYLGNYTYGLYVYSGFVLTFGINFIPIKNNLLVVIIEFIILLIIAFTSYHLFEKQFLKLKKHFRS